MHLHLSRTEESTVDTFNVGTLAFDGANSKGKIEMVLKPCQALSCYIVELQRPGVVYSWLCGGKICGLLFW